MKKNLVTWYGMADFLASLEFKQIDGPVLGALLAEDYTDVFILGFTQQDKEQAETDKFQQKIKNIKNGESNTEREIINQYSNTTKAHHHFNNWLSKKLIQAGKGTKIHFHSVKLKHLNDTEGIYEAATQSLNTICLLEGEKLVTLHLSPGTPVMAFVWAFVALRFPNLKKRLIASSKLGEPPEQIVLPSEWLEWHGKQVGAINGDLNHYDAIFHLFGEQRMPSLLGILQFSCKKHIFVNSIQFPAEVMKQFIVDSEFAEIPIDPYDPENVRTTILDTISKMPGKSKIGFNLTGGTKLMYAGALAACRKVNATPFYFNNRNNQVIFLNDFKSEDTKTISSVEAFIKLNTNDLTISKAGHWEDLHGANSAERIKLTNALWQVRSKISRMYRELSNYNNSFEPFEIYNQDIYAKLSRDKSVKININKKHFEFKEWADFAKYLSGGWLEEYTFLMIQPLVNSGVIKDIRIGLEVTFKKDATFVNPLKDIYQELDVVFTDGKRLYIIECKAGSVKGEHVSKLESITRYFGGNRAGYGILAYCFAPKNSGIKQKAKEAHNIHLMPVENIHENLKSLIHKVGRAQ